MRALTTLTLFSLLASLVAAGAPGGRAVPPGLKAFKDSIVAQGGCKNVLKDERAGGGGNSEKTYYCADHADDKSVIYLTGDGNKLADMDTDCDGAGATGGGQCGNDPSNQAQTAFKDTIKGYGKGVDDIAAQHIPYVVLGNKDFNLEDHGIKPLSVVAVVCGDKLVYGVWADTNGENSTGEASISLASMCYDGMSGNSGHGDMDVLYLAFKGDEAVPGASAPWNTQDPNEFEGAIAGLGDKLVARFGGDAPKQEPPKNDKPKDDKPKDDKPKDGKPKDGKPKDGKPKDGKPKDGNNNQQPKHKIDQGGNQHKNQQIHDALKPIQSILPGKPTGGVHTVPAQLPPVIHGPPPISDTPTPPNSGVTPPPPVNSQPPAPPTTAPPTGPKSGNGGNGLALAGAQSLHNIPDGSEQCDPEDGGPETAPDPMTGDGALRPATVPSPATTNPSPAINSPSPATVPVSEGDEQCDPEGDAASPLPPTQLNAAGTGAGTGTGTGTGNTGMTDTTTTTGTTGTTGNNSPPAAAPAPEGDEQCDPEGDAAPVLPPTQLNAAGTGTGTGSGTTGTTGSTGTTGTTGTTGADSSGTTTGTTTAGGSASAPASPSAANTPLSNSVGSQNTTSPSSGAQSTGTQKSGGGGNGSKEDKKAQKEADRAARKAQKEQEKQQRKAERKAKKEADKAARKAKKEAEKAAKNGGGQRRSFQEDRVAHRARMLFAPRMAGA